MNNARGLPVRYRILALFFMLGFVNYLLRNNLSIAIPTIHQEYGFTNTELGWILGSFSLTYTLFQIPGGIWGDRIGARRALAIIAVAWGVLTFLTGFAPGIAAASAGGAMAALIAVRLLLGVANAPIFPAQSKAIANWFPVDSWAFPNAVGNVALALAQAALGPLVSFLIIWLGWRASFYALAPLGIVAGIWWYWYARDTPIEHPAISRAELDLIAQGRPAADAVTHDPKAWRKVMVRRDALLLAASYFCYNYVFYMFAQWLFTYLVEARGFSLLESGALYALPFTVGAIFAAVGGVACDRLSRRFGILVGCRAVAMTGLVLVAVFLLAGAHAANAYVAVALFSLCFGCAQLTEGPYWAAATYAGGDHPGTATGVMNTGGNAPGLLAPVVGMMVDRLGWDATLASGSIFALAAAALWLMVRLQRD